MMFLATLSLLPLIAVACPGSATKIHAKCDMGVKFGDSCDSIISEITGRVNSDWVDPHNGGTYSITNITDSYLAGQRLTGDEKYTDLFDFSFTTVDGGCQVEACSESQVMSIKDFSTNYCNLHSLYCSSVDGCVSVGAELTYSEDYKSCSQHDDVCVASSVSLNGKPSVSVKCQKDIQDASADITKAGIDIAKAVEDCESYTAACNDDINAILEELTSATNEITAAVYDCAGEQPTACSQDVDAILADLTGATVAITDAVIDCVDDAQKCTKDILAATDMIVKAGVDIAKAVTDCA